MFRTALRPTGRLLAETSSSWRTPSIAFPGKGRWQGSNTAGTPSKPHPMAPQAIIDSFAEFRNKQHASARPGSHDSQPRLEAEEAMSRADHEIGTPNPDGATFSYGGPAQGGPTGKDERGKPLPKADFENFWELPSRITDPLVLRMTDAEMSLIDSGGADEHFLEM